MKKKIMFKQFLLSSCRPGQALSEILRFALDDITKRNHKSEIINQKSPSALHLPIHLLNLLSFLAHIAQLAEDEKSIAIVDVLIVRESAMLLDGVHLVRLQYDEVLILSALVRSEEIGELVAIFLQARLHEMEHHLEGPHPSLACEFLPMLFAVR